MYAAPDGHKNLPAILHIHGGGQTVNERWLEFWTDRGYAVMSFNWGGEWPDRERYTLWGKLTQGNHRQSNNMKVDPTPHINSWYHWTLISRRALTYLEMQREVDPERIGAFGVSMGGTIMWYLAMDKRIKAGCAIYGVGWNTYRWEPKYAVESKPEEVKDEILRWRSAMAPEAYAPYIEFPMLFLSSTNDQHGNMDRAYDTLKAVPQHVPRCQAFTPRYRHHIGPDQGENLILWMDTWLKGARKWPDTPETSVELSADGVPIISVKPDNSQEIKQVEVLYALENPWTVDRHWRSARSIMSGKEWVARTPVIDVDKYLFVYANVHYKSGICLSSKLEAVIPTTLGAVEATDKISRIIYDGSEGLAGWIVNFPGTDPIPPIPVHIRPAVGPEGKKGFSVYQHSSSLTYAIGDPKWRDPEGAVLQFDVATTEGEEFIVVLHKRPLTPDSKEYHTKVLVKGDTNWQTANLSLDQFWEKGSGQMLRSWRDVTALELKLRQGHKWNDSNIVFRNFRWAKQ